MICIADRVVFVAQSFFTGAGFSAAWWCWEPLPFLRKHRFLWLPPRFCYVLGWRADWRPRKAGQLPIPGACLSTCWLGLGSVRWLLGFDARRETRAGATCLRVIKPAG